MRLAHEERKRDNIRDTERTEGNKEHESFHVEGMYYILTSDFMQYLIILLYLLCTLNNHLCPSSVF